ncbi:MAG: transcription elongation factor GreA [Candidatus Berkelbacteria bacterium]|nr:transcription elongation factor GreA [Candidatus Berkelbacteria bacterium]
MAVKSINLTKAGKEKLESELEELKKIKRPQVIERIKRAKDFGDLSENAEYEDARNEQSFIEGRIQEIEYILKYAQIVENGKSRGVVALGSKVTVSLGGDKVGYELVGSTEADPSSGKISSESPIGSAILGKKVGEMVVAKTPSGSLKVKVLKIQ